MISGSILIIDQLTKFIIAATFVPSESHPVLPPILHLTYVQNTGAAFGMLKGQQLIFIILSLVVIGWVGRELILHPRRSRIMQWGCALLLGGAAGNLIDRLRLGYVIDFLDFRIWPVFNVGDSAITIGVVLLMWHSMNNASDSA